MSSIFFPRKNYNKRQRPEHCYTKRMQSLFQDIPEEPSARVLLDGFNDVVLDYAIPCKECCDNPGSSEDPCEMFSRIPFPAQEFSPTGCDDHDCRDSNYQTC